MERRILGRLKGDATEEFHASQGYLDLQVSVSAISPHISRLDSLPNVPGVL